MTQATRAAEHPVVEAAEVQDMYSVWSAPVHVQILKLPTHQCGGRIAG